MMKQCLRSNLIMSLCPASGIRLCHKTVKKVADDPYSSSLLVLCSLHRVATTVARAPQCTLCFSSDSVQCLSSFASQEALIEKIRLKNSALKVQRRKVRVQLRQVREQNHPLLNFLSFYRVLCSSVTSDDWRLCQECQSHATRDQCSILMFLLCKNVPTFKQTRKREVHLVVTPPPSPCACVNPIPSLLLLPPYLFYRTWHRGTDVSLSRYRYVTPALPTLFSVLLRKPVRAKRPVQ